MNHSTRQAIIDNVNYENDGRVLAGRRRGGMVEDWGRSTITYVGIDYREDEEGRDLVLPAEPCVCPTCNGRGKHVNPSVDAGGLSAEDFAEDPDFAESYFSGHYDVTCEECGGRNVVLQVNVKRARKDDLAVLEQHVRSEQEYRAIRRAEMMMGA